MANGTDKCIIGAINGPSRGSDPKWDQSAAMPDLGKGDLSPVSPVPPAPYPGPNPFANPTTGRK